MFYNYKMESQNDETIFTKLTINNKPAYIKIVWQNDDSSTNIFSIQIFYNDHSWSGSFTRAASEKYRGRLKETNKVYLNEVKKCLSKESPTYRYEFVKPSITKYESLSTSNENSATFSWKKLFEGSSAVIVHGSVEVQENIDTKNSLIDCLLQENQILKNNLEDCKDKRKKENFELEKYRNELENVIIMKSSMEDTLYSKFSQLLNAKKRRIQVLEDALNNIENI